MLLYTTSYVLSGMLHLINHYLPSALRLHLLFSRRLSVPLKLGYFLLCADKPIQFLSVWWKALSEFLVSACFYWMSSIRLGTPWGKRLYGTFPPLNSRTQYLDIWNTYPNIRCKDRETIKCETIHLIPVHSTKVNFEWKSAIHKFDIFTKWNTIKSTNISTFYSGSERAKWKCSLIPGCFGWKLPYSE